MLNKIPFFASTALAMSISDLLDSAVKQPDAFVSELDVHESDLNRQAVTDELYPKLSLFRYEE
ncbi:MAG: hypothetical protein KKD44_17080 [Proteobacteria bacterium]|nr:hypothetical protein [Pseudomonadota bacterium]